MVGQGLIVLYLLQSFFAPACLHGPSVQVIPLRNEVLISKIDEKLSESFGRASQQAREFINRALSIDERKHPSLLAGKLLRILEDMFPPASTNRAPDGKRSSTRGRRPGWSFT